VIALAGLMVAGGAGVVAAGLHASRTVAAGPDAGAAALIEDAPARPGLAYRAAEPLLAWAARMMRALSPVARLELTRRRIGYAGLEGRRTVEQVLRQKAFAAGGGVLFGLFMHPSHLPALLTAIVVGVLASFVPDVLLDAAARKRQALIARALPDALDLLSITVEAGLGLEQALAVVADQLVGPLGDELRRLLREIELGVDRRSALQLLRERTDVRELSAFVVALLQADALGMAISDVLRVQAEQVRLVRRQRARELAAKTPVKIMFPVVIGIFPSLFVVTIGPGAINIVRTLFR
jgi:tight adherence protein C